jgi:hypothetical protein
MLFFMDCRKKLKYKILYVSLLFELVVSNRKKKRRKILRAFFEQRSETQRKEVKEVCRNQENVSVSLVCSISHISGRRKAYTFPTIQKTGMEGGHNPVCVLSQFRRIRFF